MTNQIWAVGLMWTLGGVAEASPSQQGTAGADPDLASQGMHGLSYSSGGYSDSVRFEVPAGVAGHSPTVGLSYAQSLPDGALGKGWNLNAGGKITRNSGSGGGVPEHGGATAETFFLNGQELHLVSNALGSWYEPEHWDGSRADYDGSSNTWTVIKDGTVSTYSYVVTVVPGAFHGTLFKGATASWMLTSVEDRFGNMVQYEYTQPSVHSTDLNTQYGSLTGEVLLSRIHWGAAEVLFNYELRPNGESTVTYRPGRREIRENRLADVEIRLGGLPYSAYDLVYTDESSAFGYTPTPTPVSLLREVVRNSTGGGADLLIRAMDYHLDSSDTWSPSTGVDYTTQLARAGTSNWEDKVQVLLSPSLNGDAFSDVVHVEYVCDATVSTGVTGRTGHELGGMLNAGVYVAKCVADVAVWVNEPLPLAGGWRLSDSYVPSFSSSDSVAQDYQAKLEEVLDQFGTGAGLNGNGQVLAQGTHWSLTDLNGDGRPEIVVGKWKNGASSFEAAKAWSYSPHDCNPSDGFSGCWTDRAMPDLPSVPGSMNKEFGWKNVQFVDIDGDGLVDLVQRPLTWGEEPVADEGSDSNSEEPALTQLPDYQYGVVGIDRDNSFWYRNNGDFTFDLMEIALDLPLEDFSRWTTEFNSVSGCGSVPTETLGVLYEHEYFESQGTLSDYNADGIADVAYSFYACENSPSHGPETGDSSRVYSEIFWGDGRGGFVASGLSAGKPNMLHENHPFPDTHGYEPESWTYRPHHASIDLNRSGRPELVNSRSDETLGYSKFINLVDGFDISGLGAQTIPDLSVPLDIEQAHSSTPLGLGNIPILGSQTPWVQASTTGDFDANGFPDLLFVNASVDSLGAVTWAVELQLSDRDESYGVLKSIENPFGGVTDLEWGSSARVGDNDQLHYTREVIAEVQRSGVDSAGYYYSEDPVELRYFKGEHALGRFRGFGMVEVTRGGASTEYGYATSPFLERKPVSVASYRSDGTLESAQVNAYGITGVGTGWAVFSWDLTAPYANPLGRSCTYEVGHGANKTDGTRGQTIDMDDLVAMCLDTPNADEWVTGNGWHADPDPLGPLANLAESIWETGDDALSEFTTSGTSGFGLVPNTFTPEGPANEGHVYAAEVDGPELLTGTTLASGPSFVGESLPNPGGPTEVWEYTKVFGYTTDIDSDGATDLLLERVDDLGLTDAPSGFTTGSVPYSGGLSADDTFVEMQYSGRWVSDWGFSLVSRTEGAGSTVHSHQEFDLFAALDVPTQVRDCGDDPSCSVSHDSYFYYHTGGTIPGTLFGIDDSEGNATTWTVDSSGPCAGMVVEEIDAEGRIRTFGRDSRCRVDLEDWEGSTTTTSYDGLNRKLAVTTAVQNVDGSVSSVEQIHAYTRNSAAVGIQTQSGASVFRVDEQTLDSFGRVIQSDTCSAPVLDCVSPISDLVRHAQTYGTDGRLFAEYGPMAVGSGEVFTSYKEYSGTGRVVAVHQSDHDVTTTAWRTTQLEYHPRTQLVWDALGVLHESYSDPLESTSIVAGVSRGYELRDPLGRVIEVEDAGGKVVARSYDGFGRVDLVWNTVSETCVTPTSGSALLTYQVEYVHDSLGRVTEEIGPDGSSLVYSYDGMGRVVTESFVDLSASTTLLKEYIYTPASPGVLPKVVEIDSETGTTIQVEADALGRLQRQTDLSGTTTWSFGDVPEPLAVQDVDGLITGFTYDGIGRLSTKSRGTGSSATPLDQYTYNAAGQLVSSMDADGVVVDIEYTLTGLPLRTSIPSGSSSRTLLSEASYDALGRVSWDNQGGVDSFYEYDSIGHLTRVDVGASSAVSGYVLDGVANGVEYSQILTYVGDQVASETLVPVHTGSGQTHYAYDAWGRLKTTTHPSGGGTESYEYDVNGFLRRHTDAVGAESEWRYTDRGELEYHKPKNQGASSYVYSAHTGGRSLQVTDPLGNTSAQHTDGLGRLLQADYANGSSVEYIYSGSRLSEELVRDASGGVTARQNHGYYSSTGWLASTWSWHDPSASVFDPSTDYAIEYAYSTAGRVIESGNQHELTGFVYDSDGMLVEEEWDEKVKLFSYTDLLYTEGGVDYYSPLLTGTDVIPTISGVGLVSEPVVTAGGSHPVRVEDYLYDGAGRMVGKTTYKGSGIPGMTMDSVDVQSYDLDAFGNPLETQVSRLTPLTPSLVSGGNISQWTYDDMGRPETRQTQTSFGLGLAGGGTAWTWYADGSLASIDTPGLQSLEYVRSLSGGEFELDTIKVNGSAAVTVSSRDALGRILGASFGGDTHAFGYDPMGRLDSRILTSSGGLTSTWTAFFTDDGQLESEQISDFNGSTWTNDYTYFEEGWLKSEVRGATGETRDYTYDSGGRRTETYVNGTLERATNWAGSRVVDIDGVAVDYDGLDGVELDHLDYAYERDATGRVAEMSDGTSGSSLYQMMRDEAGRVVTLDDGAGARVTTWGLGLGGLPLEVEDSTGALLNYVGAEGIVFGLSDGSSLTSVMTDGTGSLLQVGIEAVEPGTAFGEGTSVSSTDARFAFAGLEALPGAPGVQMSQQRMYDSETGRFLSPDPIGLGGGNHRTRYGSGNPTRYTDPTGYMNWDAFMVGSENFGSDWSANLPAYGGSEAHLYFQPPTQHWIQDSWSGSSMRMWSDHMKSMDQMKMNLAFSSALFESVLGGPSTDFAAPMAFGDRFRDRVGQFRDWASTKYDYAKRSTWHLPGREVIDLWSVDEENWYGVPNRATWKGYLLQGLASVIGFVDFGTRSEFLGGLSESMLFLPATNLRFEKKIGEAVAARIDPYRSDVQKWTDENLVRPAFEASPAGSAYGNAVANVLMTGLAVSGAPEVRGKGPLPRVRSPQKLPLAKSNQIGSVPGKPDLPAGQTLPAASSKIGHTTPWAEMTTAQRRAFQHSYSRHGAELGLPKWSQKNAGALQTQFNQVVGHIRANGSQVSGVRKPFNGSSVDVNFFEATFEGTNYYYYETLDGVFISAGKAR